MQPTLVVESVFKSFGYVAALKGVSLRVMPGEVFGLLGPNGSGKSTLMKLALAMLPPDSGFIQCCGFDTRLQSLDVRRVTGYVPESPRLYEYLTGVEYLDFVADMRGLDAKLKKDRILHFLHALQLAGREDELISGYSLGMKQKLALIAAFLPRPRLLVLDEPLNGLDPRSARIAKDLLHGLAREGLATVLSTHVLEIAEAICDRIAVINQGVIVAEGAATDLRRMAGMPESTLEDVFLKLTGTEDVRPIVEALLA